MTTVICQYTGLAFEARSSRAKNHPALADLLSQAHRDGRYGEMAEMLHAVHKAGGYTTIEEFLTLLGQRQSRRREIAEKQRAAEAESKRNFAELQQRRRERNAALKTAGFHWEGDWGEETFDEIEEPSGRPPTHWYLLAPDGKEIAEGKAAAIVAGETTLAAVRAAEAEAKREHERQQEARRQEEAAEQQREADARRRIETIEVEPFDRTGLTCIYRHQYNPYTSSETAIYAGKANGVAVGVVNHYSSAGNDFMDSYRYYCADPEAAGLTRIKQDAPDSRPASLDFFGL